MECSVELSMYPLTSDYESTIISFIKRLRKHPFISVETNGMSTQIFGDYDRVMNAVKSEMKNTFLSDEKFVFNMKVINGNLSKKPRF